MIPSLILVDFAITLFYLKNGFFMAKIKANFDIIKNFNIISKNKFIKFKLNLILTI